MPLYSGAMHSFHDQGIVCTTSLLMCGFFSAEVLYAQFVFALMQLLVVSDMQHSLCNVGRENHIPTSGWTAEAANIAHITPRIALLGSALLQLLQCCLGGSHLGSHVVNRFLRIGKMGVAFGPFFLKCMMHKTAPRHEPSQSTVSEVTKQSGLHRQALQLAVLTCTSGTAAGAAAVLPEDRRERVWDRHAPLVAPAPTGSLGGKLPAGEADGGVPSGTPVRCSFSLSARC